MATTRMDGYDAVLWQTESHRLLRSGIVAVVQLDGAPDPDSLRARVAELAEGLPRLRTAPLRRPRPLATHRWRELEDVDADEHLFWTSAADIPGGLAGLISLLLEEPYEAGSPLWSFHVVTDLPDGRAAVLSRLHHSITDGLGAMTMAACFFDTDAAGTRISTAPPRLRPRPRTVGARLGAIGESVLEDASAAAGLGLAAAAAAPSLVAAGLRRPVPAARRSAAFAASLARLLAPVDSLSPAFGDRDARPAVGLLAHPLDDLRSSARTTGGSINDAFVAALALGLQAYHEQQGAQAAEVRLSMPVSYRAAGDGRFGGNQFTAVRLRLPIAAETATEALQAVAPRLRAARAEPALRATPAVTEVVSRLPGPITNAIVAGMLTRTELLASNVPGPPMPLWCAGRPVTSIHAASPRMGTGVSACLISYDGTANVLVNMDRGAVADPDLLLKCIKDGFVQVVALGRDPSPATPARSSAPA